MKTEKTFIPFDYSKMKPDFSNVVYRNGERPQFVCRRQEPTFTFLSVNKNGAVNTHKDNGQTSMFGDDYDHDLFLEVEAPRMYTEEEHLKEMEEFWKWDWSNSAILAGDPSTIDFKKVYENFKNRNK